MPAAPNGMLSMHLGEGETGAESNELAISAAFQHYAKEHGVGAENLATLGFEHSNHGTTLSAEFPQLKYPIWKYEHENNAEERRCIESYRNLIHAHRSTGGHVGAVIVSPTSAYGNHFATPNFFKGVRNIAKVEGIPFIVDETETGIGSSGKNWGHDHWYLSDEQTPDYMTFGGKSELGGFYCTLSHRLNDGGTSF